MRALPHEPPDVELGPVRQREDAEVLAALVTAVVEPPQLRPLVLRVPLTELVAVAEHALLGPRSLLVATGPAEDGVEAVLGDRVEQRDGLQRVAAGTRTGVFDDPSGVDRILHRRDDELDSELLHGAIAELDQLGEVVTGVDVHDRERDAGRRERPDREVEHDHRVLAAGEQQHRSLELGRDLADDRDRLVFEMGGRGERCGHPSGQVTET